MVSKYLKHNTLKEIRLSSISTQHNCKKLMLFNLLRHQIGRNKHGFIRSQPQTLFNYLYGSSSHVCTILFLPFCCHICFYTDWLISQLFGCVHLWTFLWLPHSHVQVEHDHPLHFTKPNNYTIEEHQIKWWVRVWVCLLLWQFKSSIEICCRLFFLYYNWTKSNTFSW